MDERRQRARWLASALPLLPATAGSTALFVVAAPIAYGAYGADAFLAVGIGFGIWLIAIGSSLLAFGRERPSSVLASALAVGAALGLAFALVGTALGVIAPALTRLLGVGAITSLAQPLSSLTQTAIQWVFTALGLAMIALVIRQGPIKAVKSMNAAMDRVVQPLLDAAGKPPAYPLFFIVALVVLSRPPALTLTWSLIGYLWAYAVCISLCLWASAAMLKTVTDPMEELAGVWWYLKAMGQTLLAYALLYCLIVAWFAACFASIYQGDHRSFAPVSEDRSFWEFLYFAVMTFPPLGYSDLHPSSPWTKVLVSAESIVGVVMTVVIFAAMTAYLGPRFKEIDERRKADAQRRAGALPAAGRAVGAPPSPEAER